MDTKRKEELESFLKKPEIELIYIYHLNPNSPDAGLAQLVLDFKKFEASQAHNKLLARQNKVLLTLTVVLALAAMLQVALSGLQILGSK
jgi:hypothetical protein